MAISVCSACASIAKTRTLWAISSNAGGTMPARGLDKSCLGCSIGHQLQRRHRQAAEEIRAPEQAGGSFPQRPRLAANGDVFITDTMSGDIYRIARGAATMEPFASLGAQHISQRHRYRRRRKDVVRRVCSRNPPREHRRQDRHADHRPAGKRTPSIDGLYFFRGSLVAIQPFEANRKVVRYFSVGRRDLQNRCDRGRARVDEAADDGGDRRERLLLHRQRATAVLPRDVQRRRLRQISARRCHRDEGPTSLNHRQPAARPLTTEAQRNRGQQFGVVVMPPTGPMPTSFHPAATNGHRPTQTTSVFALFLCASVVRGFSEWLWAGRDHGCDASVTGHVTSRTNRPRHRGASLMSGHFCSSRRRSRSSRLSRLSFHSGRLSDLSSRSSRLVNSSRPGRFANRQQPPEHLGRQTAYQVLAVDEDALVRRVVHDFARCRGAGSVEGSSPVAPPPATAAAAVGSSV